VAALTCSICSCPKLCVILRQVKKVLVSILAILYLAVASGVEMNIHYCMGEVASVEYGSADHGPCGKCGMESKKGCCEDETKIVKLQDSHQLAKTNHVFQASGESVLPATFEYDDPVFAESPVFTSRANSPPPGSETPLYILHCVYRI
jgi:hypothetical protein